MKLFCAGAELPRRLDSAAQFCSASTFVHFGLISSGGLVRYLDRLQPLALLVMRLSLGIIITAHGYQKVFGGLHHHVEFVASLGLPGWMAYLSAFTEFVGGILVLVGLFTRAAAFAICINLSVAIWRVHWHKGLTGSGAIEFPLALATVAFALIFFGAGPIAMDHVLRGGSNWSKK
jgi:putative oxidoreductase